MKETLSGGWRNGQPHSLERISRKGGKGSSLFITAFTVVLMVTYFYADTVVGVINKPEHVIAAHRASLIAKCNSIRTPAGPPASFRPSSRLEAGNERWVPGTPPVLLKNAKIWTGARDGTEVVFGDALLDRGLVVAVGYIPPSLLEKHGGANLTVIDAAGKWVTPGLVDLHSHLGVMSAPGLRGAADTNSHKAPILPWLRSIDGMNTRDAAYELAIAGGVTTAQILPGSDNNIGGQAFVIKLRPTAERSATSKVIEPPWTLTHNDSDAGDYVRWRHMKHACGENADRTYSQTRMDGQWNFRNAYNEARKIREKQDAFCAKVDIEDWGSLQNGYAEFPEDLQWESLVDVLRGRVKLAIHCYEAVDLDGIVRLSNEFKFPVASFHHAGETYLVPDLLKKTFGGAPSIALFASNFRMKREAYRGSEFAPRILSEHGIPVVMKSDHPVVNSRYLLFEAQQAFFYGLNPALALASVTSVPARAAGLGHRVGTIAEGYDADLVIWDSHPLSLGATPQQVFIDGIAQFLRPHTLEKPASFQELPKVPNWDREKNETIEYEGLPPLKGSKKYGRIRITGVKSVINIGDIKRIPDGEQKLFDEGYTVIVEDGKIVCIENFSGYCPSKKYAEDEFVWDLKGGVMTPGLTTYGSPLGLVEIQLEPSTNDGVVADPLVNGNFPKILGEDGTVVMRAVDGLTFEGRNALLAYRSGVTTAVTAPSSNGFLLGLGTAFSTGASNVVENGAVVQDVTALHIIISYNLPVSISTQFAALRKALFEEIDPDESDVDGIWDLVQEGEMTLVISVQSADAMSTLIKLKSEYEGRFGKTLKMTFAGATESHLIAEEIARAGVSVILTSPRPYPGTWEQKRIIPGPPLTQESPVTRLLNAGVEVAIGVIDGSAARNTWFDLAWIALEANGTISESQTIDLATTNLHKALGLTALSAPDIVLYEGGSPFDFDGKVVGVVSPGRGLVEMFSGSEGDRV